jgi:hypothetical protein
MGFSPGWKGNPKTVGIIQPIPGVVNFQEKKAPEAGADNPKQSQVKKRSISALFSFTFGLDFLEVFPDPFFDGVCVQVYDGYDFILALFARDDLQRADPDSEDMRQKVQQSLVGGALDRRGCQPDPQGSVRSNPRQLVFS